MTTLDGPTAQHAHNRGKSVLIHLERAKASESIKQGLQYFESSKCSGMIGDFDVI